MNRREARKNAMAHPSVKKEGFVIIQLTDDSTSWQPKGKSLPEGARIVEDWVWRSGWSSKTLEFDESDRKYIAQFLDIEALFAIDWTKLSFPGYAGSEHDLEYFPYKLCDLTSSDPVVWSEASHVLHDLVDDGIISTLTTQAVPFLLQLVRNPVA